MGAVEVRHAGKIEIDGRCRGTGSAAQPVEVGAPRRGGSGTGDPADAGGTARQGDRRRPRGVCQHGTQLAGLLCAGRSGGAAAAPEARTTGQDRAACRGDRRGDPDRRCAPRRRLDVAALRCRDARRGGPAISPRWLSHQLRQRGLPSAARATHSKAARTKRRWRRAASALPI